MEGDHARPSATKVFALCEIAKIAADELFAKSEDQLSSDPDRRRRNHTAPPAAATAAATALFFGTRESSSRLGTADFALRFAIVLLAFHTAQPRIAFRLFTTLMLRGYPTAIPLTHGRTPPPERRPVLRREVTPAVRRNRSGAPTYPEDAGR